MNENEPEPAETPSQIDKLTHDLEAEKQQSEDYLNRLKYAQADIENLKKRYERQLEETRKYCTEPLVIRLLEVVDELQLAVKHARTCDDKQTLVEGVEMTLKKLEKILKDQGVSPIESVGKPFDPTKQVAAAPVESGDTGECTVTEEVRKGYMIREKVIRPSIVKVTAKPLSKSETGGCMKNE